MEGGSLVVKGLSSLALSLLASAAMTIYMQYTEDEIKAREACTRSNVQERRQGITILTKEHGSSQWSWERSHQKGP